MDTFLGLVVVGVWVAISVVGLMRAFAAGRRACDSSEKQESCPDGV